jgi:biopolymer transport protein TolR
MATGPNPSSRGGRVSLSEINVTPLVDVMLVLLIVFMVSAPLLQQGVEVNLPKADAGNLARSEEPMILTIRSDSSLDLDGKSVPASALSDRLASLARSKPDLQILVQADQSIAYGVVAKVMAALKKANIHRVGLVTAPESAEPR